MLSNVGEFVFACLGESPVARLVFLNESGFGEFGDVAVGGILGVRVRARIA